MNARDFIEKINNFEKYSILLDVDNDTLRKLDEIIKKYQTFYSVDNKCEDNLKGIIKEFNLILKKNNLDINDLNDLNIIELIKELVNKEILVSDKYINYLKIFFDNNSVFLLDTFNDTLSKNKFIKKDYILKLKNGNNKNELDELLKLFDLLDKSNFNKDELIEKIIVLEKNIINKVEEEINKICFILGIDYKEKDMQKKYFDIIDITKDKKEAYKLLFDKLIMYEELIKEVNNLNLSFNIDDIKNIRKDGLDLTLEKVRIYNLHKEDNKFSIKTILK